MAQHAHIIDPSGDETEELDLPPVKMCEICGRFPCQHWFTKLRENNAHLMNARHTMRSRWWSRWPREQRARGRGPIVAGAFAVGVLIAGVGINACLSGSAPVHQTATAPYFAAGPGPTSVPLPLPGGTPTTAGPTQTAGTSGGRSAGSGTDAGSQPVVGAPAHRSVVDDPGTAQIPVPSTSPLPLPLPSIKAPAPVKSVVGTVVNALPKITIGDGTVTVGIDVPVGTYIAQVAPLTCVWKILSGGLLGTVVGVSTLLGGTQTVHLKDGQTFTSRRCGGFVQQ